MTAKLLNATNARSTSTVNSSQRRQTRRSSRHTILRCDELTGSLSLMNSRRFHVVTSKCFHLAIMLSNNGNHHSLHPQTVCCPNVIRGLSTGLSP